MADRLVVERDAALEPVDPRTPQGYKVYAKVVSGPDLRTVQEQDDALSQMDPRVRYPVVAALVN